MSPEGVCGEGKRKRERENAVAGRDDRRREREKELNPPTKRDEEKVGDGRLTCLRELTTGNVQGCCYWS